MHFDRGAWEIGISEHAAPTQIHDVSTAVNLLATKQLSWPGFIIGPSEKYPFTSLLETGHYQDIDELGLEAIANAWYFGRRPRWRLQQK